jgi:hypothetical protein
VAGVTRVIGPGEHADAAERDPFAGAGPARQLAQESNAYKIRRGQQGFRMRPRQRGAGTDQGLEFIKRGGFTGSVGHDS